MARKKLKLDLACGQRPTDGFTGVDIWAGAEIVHDLLTFPWPFADRSVDEVVCNHFVEHIPMTTTESGQDLLCAFMDELWRIMRPGARATIQHPHLHSDRAFQDPTHRRFIPWQTWLYFNAEWRKANGLDHYDIACDFEVINIEGMGINPDVAARAHEVQMRMSDQNWNVAADTRVIFERKK